VRKEIEFEMASAIRSHAYHILAEAESLLASSQDLSTNLNKSAEMIEKLSQITSKLLRGVADAASKQQQ